VRWCRNFIVNAPGFFSLIWRVAEPMLSPTTRRKIRLLHNKQVLNDHIKFQILKCRRGSPARFMSQVQGALHCFASMMPFASIPLCLLDMMYPTGDLLRAYQDVLEVLSSGHRIMLSEAKLSSASS